MSQEAILNLLDKLYQAKLKYVVLSTLAYIFAFTVILPQMSMIVEQVSKVSVTPDSDFFYTLERLIQIRSLYSKAGVQAYVQTRFTYDLLWPIIYTFFTISTIGYFSKNLKKTRVISGIYFLPIGAFCFDILENSLCSLFFMKIGPLWLGHLASLFSAIKWIMVLGMMSAQLLLLILFLGSRIKSLLM